MFKLKRNRIIALVLAVVIALSAVIGTTFALTNKAAKEVRLKQQNGYTTIAPGKSHGASATNVAVGSSSNSAVVTSIVASGSGMSARLTTTIAATAPAGIVGISRATRAGTVMTAYLYQIVNENGIAGYDLPNGGNGFTTAASGSIASELAKIQFYKLGAVSTSGTAETTIAANAYVPFTPAASEITWTSLNTEVVSSTMTIAGNGITVLLGEFTDRWGEKQVISYLFGVGVAPGSTGTALSNLLEAIEAGRAIITSFDSGNPNGYAASDVDSLRDAVATALDDIENERELNYVPDTNAINAIVNKVNGVGSGGSGNDPFEATDPANPTQKKKLRKVYGPGKVYEELTGAGESYNPPKYIYDPNDSLGKEPPALDGDEKAVYKDGYVYYADAGTNVFYPIDSEGNLDQNNPIWGGGNGQPGGYDDRPACYSGGVWYAEDPAGSNVWKPVNTSAPNTLNTANGSWVGGGSDGKPGGSDDLKPIASKNGQLVAGPFGTGEDQYYIGAGPNGRFDTAGHNSTGRPQNDTLSGDDVKLYDQGNGSLGTEKPGATVQSLTITGTPTKTAYKPDESFLTGGLTIKLNYSDGTSDTITSGFTVSPDPLTEGITSVTITHTASGKTATVSGITVKKDTTGGNLGEDDPIEFDYEAVDANIGKIFNADGYEWVVIGADTTNGNRELLITTTGLVGKTDFGDNNTYASSWLNGEMEDVFDGLVQLKNYIQPLTEAPVSNNVTAVNNAAVNGDMLRNSMKLVFPLSEAEITKYFADSRVSAYKTASNADTNWYWLRTASTTGMASRIDKSGVMAGTDVTNINGGIRPAMWINLGTDILIKDKSVKSTFRRNLNKIFKADGIYWRVINLDENTGDMLIVSRDNMGTCSYASGSKDNPGYLGSNLRAQIVAYNSTSKLARLYPLMQSVTINAESPASYDPNTKDFKTYADELGTKTAFALSVSDINEYFIAGIDGKATAATYWLRTPAKNITANVFVFGASYGGSYSSYYYRTSSTGVTHGNQASVNSSGDISLGLLGSYLTYGSQLVLNNIAQNYYTKKNVPDAIYGIRPAMFINFG